MLYEKEKSNTYYYPNSSCIRQKHPEFLPQDIEIEDAVCSTLLPVHFELLQSVFTFSWWTKYKKDPPSELSLFTHEFLIIKNKINLKLSFIIHELLIIKKKNNLKLNN